MSRTTYFLSFILVAGLATGCGLSDAGPELAAAADPFQPISLGTTVSPDDPEAFARQAELFGDVMSATATETWQDAAGRTASLLAEAETEDQTFLGELVAVTMIRSHGAAMGSPEAAPTLERYVRTLIETGSPETEQIEQGLNTLVTSLDPATLAALTAEAADAARTALHAPECEDCETAAPEGATLDAAQARNRDASERLAARG